MTVYIFTTTIEDPCGENRQIESIKVCKSLDVAYKFVMEWANSHLRPSHNSMERICDGHYVIKEYPETGPDAFYECWIEEDVLYE